MRELYKLLKRYHERRTHDMEGSALVASVLFNIHKAADTPALSPKDFFEAPKQPEPPEPKDWTRVVEGLNAAFGGKDLRRKAVDK